MWRLGGGTSNGEHSSHFLTAVTFVTIVVAILAWFGQNGALALAAAVLGLYALHLLSIRFILEGQQRQRWALESQWELLQRLLGQSEMDVEGEELLVPMPLDSLDSLDSQEEQQEEEPEAEGHGSGGQPARASADEDPGSESTADELEPALPLDAGPDLDLPLDVGPDLDLALDTEPDLDLALDTDIGAEGDATPRFDLPVAADLAAEVDDQRPPGHDSFSRDGDAELPAEPNQPDGEQASRGVPSPFAGFASAADDGGLGGDEIGRMWTAGGGGSRGEIPVPRHFALGTVALIRDLLTPAEVARVLLEQRSRPDVKFASLAVEMGLLTDAQREELLLAQQEGLYTEAEMRTARQRLTEFRESTARALAEIE